MFQVGGVKIGKNDYIAANYDIYYDKIKVFNIYMYGKERGIIFSSNISWEDIQVEPLVYSEIEESENEYKSMPLAEYLISYDRIKNSWLMAYAGANAASKKFPNASSALLYFLTSGQEGKTSNGYLLEEDIYKEGHTMREIDLYSAIEGDNKIEEKMKQNISEAKYIAERLGLSNGETITFSNVFETSGQTQEKGDWYLTLNRYRIKMECIVSREEKNYIMNVRYGIIDYYDWEANGDYSKLLINFSSTLLKEMSKAGMARNYTNYGEIYFMEIW